MPSVAIAHGPGPRAVREPATVRIDGSAAVAGATPGQVHEGEFGVAAGLAMASCRKKTETTTTTTTNIVAAPKEYTVGWTIYAGWMPWPYAKESGILQKWADKYGVKINLVQVNDYVESLNQFTAGK